MFPTDAAAGSRARFGLAGNPALDALMAETADNLRFHHARSNQPKLRTHVSFIYQALRAGNRPAGHAGQA
jgi:hypothetical protein